MDAPVAWSLTVVPGPRRRRIPGPRVLPKVEFEPFVALGLSLAIANANALKKSRGRKVAGQVLTVIQAGKAPDGGLVVTVRGAMRPLG